MVCIGMKIAVPPKRNEKAWIVLRKEIGRRRRDTQERVFTESVRRKHDLEQEIERLKALPANEGRKRAIRQLQKELGKI